MDTGVDKSYPREQNGACNNNNGRIQSDDIHLRSVSERRLAIVDASKESICVVYTGSLLVQYLFM